VKTSALRLLSVSAFGLLAISASCAVAVKDGEKIAFLGGSITNFGSKQPGGYVNLGVDGLGRCGIKVENEQLRELCVTVIDDWMSKVCPTFPFCECGGEYQDCTDETCGNQIYRQMARELVGWAHEHD
jgi:hypothetical protein